MVVEKQNLLWKEEKEKKERQKEKIEAYQKFARMHEAMENEKLIEEKLLLDIEHKEHSKQEEITKLQMRETDLYKYKFKIKDLKKSRHVLTHRAKEMQQSLQPKEEEIDKLKDQLLRLEEDFEVQSSKL